MSTFSRWLAPVRQIACAFFRHDVTLKRKQGQVHVVLAEREAPVKPRKVERAEGERRRQHEESMLVRTELAALLNDLPETRATMRHLVFVEQAIAKKGLKVLHKMPLDVLRRAHEQLENIVINWSAAGLANLRSKMAVAIIDRENMDPDAEADAYRTAAVLEGGAADMDLPAMPIGEAPPRNDDEALAAAYAVLGDMASGMGELHDGREPALVEMQGELGSVSARALRPQHSGFGDESAEISVRVLQP